MLSWVGVKKVYSTSFLSVLTQHRPQQLFNATAILMSKTHGFTRAPRALCFVHRSARVARLECPNAHVRQELHASLLVFFSAFLRRFRPENGVKSPNCRFFRGRKPDVVSFQFSLSLAFLLEILTSGLYTLES